MTKSEVIQHSVLIVSASEQFNELVKKALSPGAYAAAEFRKSASLARRYLLERYYDMIVINGPLPDETGEELALDAAEQCGASILLLVPRDLYEDTAERVIDEGILVMSKPFPKGGLDKAVRFLAASQNKIRRLEKRILTVQEKMEEMRIIGKAKLLLMEKERMTEDEAHRLIGKQAMDQGISRGRAAQKLIDRY